MVIVCQEMKWTYQQYIEQPNWFLEMLLMKLRVDVENEQKEIKRMKKNAKGL